MPMKSFLLVVLVAVIAAACSSTPSEEPGHETPEAAVNAWFTAMDVGDVPSASDAIHAESLALILGIENDLDPGTIAGYLDNGVPHNMQAAYWASFSEGFVEFASRPIATLTVGESKQFSSEGENFASVPVGGGSMTGSVVIARMTPDGSWEVDLVASLGDGFAKLLASAYDGLPDNDEGDRIRQAYADTVAPSLWAAMAEGGFGDDFTRSALAIIERIKG